PQAARLISEQHAERRSDAWRGAELAPDRNESSGCVPGIPALRITVAFSMLRPRHPLPPGPAPVRNIASALERLNHQVRSPPLAAHDVEDATRLDQKQITRQTIQEFLRGVANEQAPQTRTGHATHHYDVGPGLGNDLPDGITWVTGNQVL